MNEVLVNAPLFFIRHGETDWNLQRRFQGQSNIELNNKGRSQAIENANLLKQSLAKQAIAPDKLNFLSSPLARARETAEIIMTTLGLPASSLGTSDALKEISFGLWEGLTPAETKQQYYQQRQKRRKDRWSIAPPGGESFASRVDEINQILVNLPAYSVIISHSGIMRIVFHILEKTPPNEAVKADIPHIGHRIWDGNTLFQYQKGFSLIKP